ncbi:unnamed protein product [Rangifer tarandus platyrhynchus]|uniref:Uncharacterized protein n=2 Tax=Rangifer tarandus platyrhynchus TaxID=3082113 RepID=A0ABN8ZJS9_RANTA|nr:unnamed protein product [Rangifer tarandus platyrhynchus]CAI9706159.1 unnamed protein product [Rangifer tarandus platyrhynchus]
MHPSPRRGSLRRHEEGPKGRESAIESLFLEGVEGELNLAERKLAPRSPLQLDMGRNILRASPRGFLSFFFKEAVGAPSPGSTGTGAVRKFARRCWRCARTKFIKPLLEPQFQRTVPTTTSPAPACCPAKQRPGSRRAGRPVWERRAWAIWGLVSGPQLPLARPAPRGPRRPRGFSPVNAAGPRGRARVGGGSKGWPLSPARRGPRGSAPPAPGALRAAAGARPRAPSQPVCVRPRPEGLCVPGRAHLRERSESLERHLTGAAAAEAERRWGLAARPRAGTPRLLPRRPDATSGARTAHSLGNPEPREAHFPGAGAGGAAAVCGLGTVPCAMSSLCAPQATRGGRSSRTCLIGPCPSRVLILLLASDGKYQGVPGGSTRFRKETAT